MNRKHKASDEPQRHKLYAPQRACVADGCGMLIPARLLMCGRHWTMVPAEMRGEIHRHYDPASVRQSKDYFAAVKAAVAKVREREGRKA